MGPMWGEGGEGGGGALTVGALRDVAAALALGDAEQLGQHAVPVAGAEARGRQADLGAAARAAAALLGRGAVQVALAAGAAVLGLLGGAAAGPAQLLAAGAADAVLLAGLHEAAVGRRALGLAGRVAAEEGPRRLGDLQRLARGADVGQGLGAPAAGHRRAGRPRAGHVRQLAALARAAGAGHAAAGVAALAARAPGLRINLPRREQPLWPCIFVFGTCFQIINIFGY